MVPCALVLLRHVSSASSAFADKKAVNYVLRLHDTFKILEPHNSSGFEEGWDG